MPTFAHYLRPAGYRTCLSGKMDFSGADQLHGYEERLTTDLSPSDFGWTPDWDQPAKLHRLVSQPAERRRSRALRAFADHGYDEEAGHQATRWLYEAAGGGGPAAVFADRLLHASS